MNIDSDFDEGLFNEYVQESDRIILKIMVDFRLLKQRPSNEEIIMNLFRGFHNLKAGAFSLRLPNMRRISHLLEDILVLFKEKRISLTDELIELIEEAIDHIDEIIINLYENGWEGNKNHIKLILKLKELVDQNKRKAEE
jgi:two-component system, chemotaxis family, sensor kinase CheA